MSTNVVITPEHRNELSQIGALIYRSGSAEARSTDGGWLWFCRDESGWRCEMEGRSKGRGDSPRGAYIDYLQRNAAGAEMLLESCRAELARISEGAP